MDIETLIERLGENTDCWTDKVHGYADLRLEASAALSVLRAENEKLRNEAEGMRSNWYKSVEKIKNLRADLARVTAERDAAVADLTFAVNKYRLFTTDINLCYLCKFNFPSSGENEQTYECPGCYGDDCFEWRGPQKED